MTKVWITLGALLIFAGCGAVGGVLIGTGAVISCGPAPMSFDQCGGGWVKTLFTSEKKEGKP